MFLRIMAVLLGLVGLGGIGIALVASQKPAAVQQAAQPAAVALAKVHILAAARPQRAGNLMVLEDVTAVDVVAGQEPAGSYADSVATRSALRGAMVRRRLAANEPIVAGDVLSPGDRGFLAAVLGSGMRAVTVAVDAVSGTAGLIWPGDHVDLMLTQTIDDREQPIDRRISGETVLTNLRVIAVDQLLVQGGQGGQANPATGGNTNRTVTLEAGSFDAERIAVAARLGKISLVVRSAADDQAAAGAEILATSTPAAAPIAPAPIAPAPIVWGGDVSPALRDHTTSKSDHPIRVYHGSKGVDEVRF